MKRLILPVLALSLIALQACKKNKTEDPVNPSQVNYALSVTGGTYPNQTTYLFGTHDFPTGSLGTSNANESASSGIIFKYGKYIFQNNFGAPATLKKFEFDENGKPKELGSFAIAGLKTIGSVDFISDTEAYATVSGYGSIPKLIKFNPTAMTVTATIDLASIQRNDAAELYYMGLVHRDGYLYMGTTYLNKAGDPLESKLYVTILDLNTGKVLKQVSDTRSTMIWNGGSEASFQPNSLVKDASGDIYVMGYAFGAKPSGILRIKSGTTDFDASYFFDLNAATGKPCLGILYFGAGNVFTVRYDDAAAYPFDLDANYNSVATCSYYKIDLAAKTTSGNISSAIPKFFGNDAFATSFNDGKIYFNASGAASNSIYSYAISGGAVKKEFDLASGGCNGFAKMN